MHELTLFSGPRRLKARQKGRGTALFAFFLNYSRSGNLCLQLGLCENDAAIAIEKIFMSLIFRLLSFSPHSFLLLSSLLIHSFSIRIEYFSAEFKSLSW